MPEGAPTPPAEASPTSGHRQARFGLLLVALIVVFAIQGIAEPSAWEQVLVSVLLGLTLLAALRAGQTRPSFVRGAVVIVAAVILASVVQAASGNIDSGATRLENALLVALAPGAVILGVVRDLQARQAVTLQAVFGVLSVYILIGMFFAFVYGTVDRFGSAPFFAGGQSATVARCLYYSFTTMTTVGYGDLTAASNLGHTLSVSEALFGQVYLVTVVAVIVSNLGRSRPVRA
jgi:hypothetical protein